MGTCFLGVSGNRFVRHEVHVPLDGKTERTAEVTNFVHADEAELLGPFLDPRPKGPPAAVQNGSCRFSQGIPSREALHEGEPPARGPAA